MKKLIVALFLCASVPAHAAIELPTILEGADAVKTVVVNLREAAEAEKARLSKKFICEDIRIKDWQEQFGAVANEWNALCSKKPTPAVPR